MLERMSRTPAAKSIRSQRSAHSSPRRAPVVIASQTSMPQSGSRHASPTIAAACAGVRRVGVGRRLLRGASACLTGLVPIQRHRTARVKAPLSTVWIWRRYEAPSGLQTCGPQRSSQSCSASVRWSTCGRRRSARGSGAARRRRSRASRRRCGRSAGRRAAAGCGAGSGARSRRGSCPRSPGRRGSGRAAGSRSRWCAGCGGRRPRPAAACGPSRLPWPPSGRPGRSRGGSAACLDSGSMPA